MIRSFLAGLAAASLAFSISSAYAVAQQPAPPQGAPAGQAAKPSQPAKKERDKDRSTNPLSSMGSSKEPIKIDADRLDVYDKEQRAVFKGDVVAVQGETTIRCTTMTVFYERQSQKGQPPQPASQASQNDSIKQIDCAGPVTVVSKDQVATSDNATFDRAANKVTLIGNAVLSQCENVTRGERIVYDLNTQVANVETKPGGRVQALFVPKDDDKSKPQQQPQGCNQQAAAQPAPAQPAAAPAATPAAGPKPQNPAQPTTAQAAAPKPAQKQRAQAN
jgi:lipopolysaccharide export system protein LptA